MLTVVTESGRDGLLPKVEGVIASPAVSDSSVSAPHLPIDSYRDSTRMSLAHPTYFECPMAPPPCADEHWSQPLNFDLSHPTALHDLSVSILHPISVCLGVFNAFSRLFTSHAPVHAEGWEGRARTSKLIITPAFESDLTCGQLVDVLRAFGPIAERMLLDHEERACAGTEVDVCICVIGHPENHA